MEKEKKSIIGMIRGFKFKVIAVVIIIILVGIICTLLGARLSTVFNTQEKTTKFGLENVGKLVTQTCYTTVLEDSKVNLDIFESLDIHFTESRQIFSYDFAVDAYMDFESIEIKKIDNNSKKIEIALPHSNADKPKLNPSSFKVYLDTEGLFSRIDLDKHNQAILKMQEQALNDCIANKLLDAADNNAEKMITSLIQGNNKYKDYTVVYNYK